ncbi:hypothetical protein [Streptomyces boninensis]
MSDLGKEWAGGGLMVPADDLRVLGSMVEALRQAAQLATGVRR